MKFYKLIAAAVMVLWACGAVAEGRIAVFDVEAAVLNTDLAKKRLTAMRNQGEYKKNVTELEALKKNYDKQVEQFQRDFDILSVEQRQATKNKIDTARTDGEHLARKIEAANQQEAQSILQELGPKLQKILPDLIKAENIGLLLPRKQVLHADASFDITAKVADKLNQAK
ncbi:OmpH family outer membrane protein [Zhongshania sp.]|uniref:OmpH family outer membrane protein n=1 Tax=Zhongshania sp. TaxID=1971902 RepID=UPI0025F41B48|nr:OmpH family outer membrane protein [Zhongshania sp.]